MITVCPNLNHNQDNITPCSEPVTVLKSTKTLTQSYVKDKTKRHIMRLKILIDNMHEAKQSQDKTQAHTHKQNNITK